MNILRLASIIILTLILVGCGDVQVALGPDSGFSKSTPVMVLMPVSDPAGMTAAMEFMLLERGFTVISESVSEQATEFRGSSTDLGGTTQAEAAVTQVQRVPTEYAIQFGYIYEYDPNLFTRVVKRFTGSIIHVPSGRVVGSVHFTGAKQPDTVILAFVRQLEDQVTKKE